MENLQRKILDATLDLIAEQGVRSVSFREVSRRAGASHQAPYHHFGSYLGILKAIAVEGFAGLNQAMTEAATPHPGSPLQALQAAGIAYVGFAARHPGHFRVMFQQSLVDLHDPEAPVVEATQTHGTLVRLCSEVTRAGISPGLDEERLTLLCWSVVHGLANLIVEGTLQAKSERAPGEDEALATAVVDALSRLLEAGGPRAPPRKAPHLSRTHPTPRLRGTKSK